MRQRRQKRQFLKSTSHLLDISPAGRNIFVSRDKQIQNRKARRIKVWMRVVAVLMSVVSLFGAT